MNIFVRKDERVRLRRHGFTLVEAPVTIAIVALLAAMVLPSLSRSKEKAKCASTQSILKQLMRAVSMYEADYGYLPTSMSALAEYVSDPDLIGEPRGDEHYLGAYGYDYHYLYPPEQPHGWTRQKFDGTSSSIAFPSKTVVIRVTGGCNGYSLLAYLDNHVEQSRYREGADVVALNDAAVRIMAAQAIQRIILSSPETSPQTIRNQAMLPDNLFKAVDFTDQNRDGYLTASDLSLYSPRPASVSVNFDAPETPYSILLEFGSKALATHDLDPNDPDLEDVKISLEDALLDAAEQVGSVFSYENLCDLVVAFSTKQDVSMGGCAQVLAAQDREEKGQLKVRDNLLQAFRNSVDAQTGEAFSEEQADTLKFFSRMLQTEPE